MYECFSRVSRVQARIPHPVVAGRMRSSSLCVLHGLHAILILHKHTHLPLHTQQSGRKAAVKVVDRSKLQKEDDEALQEEVSILRNMCVRMHPPTDLCEACVCALMSYVRACVRADRPVTHAFVCVRVSVFVCTCVCACRLPTHAKCESPHVLAEGLAHCARVCVCTCFSTRLGRP